MRCLISGTSGMIGGSLQAILGRSMPMVSIGRRRDCDIVADFGDAASLAALNVGGYECFIHCAGVTDEEFAADALKAYQRSTYYFSTLVEKLVKQGIRQVVYFSAGQVYGRFEGHIDESSTVNPTNDYSIGHYVAEQILRRFSEQAGLRVLVVRPGAVYGLPRDWTTFKRWHLIPFAFPLACAYRQRIELRSSGLQQRDFVSVEDVAGYLLSYFSEPTAFAQYEVLNPAGQRTLSVYDFALTCATVFTRLTQRPVDIVRPNDPTGEAPSAQFVYQSRHGGYAPIHTPEQYLEVFLGRVLRDMPTARYGSGSN